MVTLRLGIISLLLVAGFCHAQTSSTPMLPNGTGIEGRITVSPSHGGPIRPGEESSRPLANATFIATSDKGATSEFTTDDQGHFKVLLEPGHYTVTKKGQGKGIGRYGPFDALVVTGQMTRLEWQCDSGMR
ncbi:MAG TPA: carboxypeptidase-like regulatory domain-containing protein [Chthoniobacterales bacterium]|nr:carboxypeptidase-like regulatory domain-containing protein [Chthoniobacterales bacterium]